jgi:sulfur-carrier protein adenylyltransferase/sulfurtransferase
MSDFTRQELERYQRHLSLPQFGMEAQTKLKRSKVLVVGAGGLGCPVLQYLAAAGVGCLGVMDFDTVDASNLQRQILFNEADVGQSKAMVAAKRLRAMNSHIEVVEIPERLTEDNALGLFSQYDVIVDGSDNFVTRYLVNDACVMTGKPLIYGAIYTFQGQVSVFNFQGGPTYRCLFPDPPDPKDAPSCSEIGVVGVLPGLIGTLQASEAIKVITGIGVPLSGTLLLLDVLTMKQQQVRFSRIEENAQISELKQINYNCELARDVPDGEEIECEELQAWLSEGRDFQLVDVREIWEREMASMGGIGIPLGQMISPEMDLPAAGLSSDIPMVTYCAVGARSLKAARVLKDRHGYTDVWSLRGGIQAWARSGGVLVSPKS